ncbi:HAD family hydrolase [Colwellia echini]|uniref:HAD family phosphatase n=1 Tax=Colwellia echini TaxID=1982103 RepID=A0ABY3N140_9GAMM|nr:HAD family phosphatase [Colwellia echini]TYK67204.1 HAD family phosphatase [Colwellia echini]
MLTKEIKAVLFDKDGTIFDSEQIYCDSWVASAKAFNVNFTAEMYDPFVGVRAVECYQRAHKMFGESFPMKDFIKHNRRYIDDKKAAGMPIKKGFITFFEQVKSLSLPIGLVTSSAHDAAILSFTGTDFMDYFTVFITGDLVDVAKPSPDCYLLAAKKLGIKPENILVFEDSSAGVSAATLAGCQTVAIPDYLPVENSLLDKCAYVVESFEDADFIIDEIRAKTKL